MATPSPDSGEAAAPPSYVPPFPPRPKTDLSPLSLLRGAHNNLLTIWPEKAFDWEFFGGRMLLQHVFVANSPDTVQAVFVDRAANYERKSPQQRHALKPLIGDGLFISDGATWRDRRRVVAPITHVSRLASLAPVMTEAAAARLQQWRGLPAGTTIDALSEMAQLTAEIICRTIFGRHLASRSARAVVDAFSAYQAAVGQMDVMSLIGLPDLLPRFQGRRVRTAATRIQAVLDGVIADILSTPADAEPSLIRSMAEATSSSTGERMTRGAFRNEAAVLFMAGHETTANTLAWAWFLLSQAPWAEAAVQAEADALGGRAATYEDLPRLRYTRAVIEETLRLYPPVPLQARQAAQADRIRNRAIPAGALVILVPWLLHRHQRLWQRPDAFEPERWLPGGSGAPSRYAYVPFSIGPRVCTGAAFGLTEAVLCLATLVLGVPPAPGTRHRRAAGLPPVAAPGRVPADGAGAARRAGMRLPPRTEWRRLYRCWVRDPLVGARLVALHHMMRALPTDAVSALGGRLGQIFGPRLHGAVERRARATLAALRPDLVPDDASMTAALSRMWDALGRVYAEFSAEDRLSPEGRVEVRGPEHARKREAGERPLIVAGVHLGNWELLPITLGYLGHQITDIYQPQRNRFEDRIAMRTRLRTERWVTSVVPQSGLHLVPPSRTVGGDLLRALKAGHALMIYVDEHVGGRVHAPSFGRPIRTDGNLARAVRLARMADADIVPAYVERVGGARYIVHFLPALPLQRTADRAADIRANAAALDAAVTAPVLAHLEQWFMLPDFRMDR